MSNNDNFIKQAFASGNFFTGFVKDPPDIRDYKFSDVMKKQGLVKTVKRKVKKYVNPKRGSYRKPNYGKVLETVVVSESVPTKLLAAISPLTIDHSSNMSSVKDQGSRGTCVAFSGAALKEFQEKIEHDKEVKAGKKYGKDGKVYNYSEQWLYWNCKQIDGYDGSGTYPRAVMKVLNKIGVPTEKAWPYTNDPINIGKPSSWSSLVSRWAVIGSYWRVNNLLELKAALVDGPVIIGVPVFVEWNMPPRGYINYPANPEKCYGSHAVCAVGYDDETQNIKFKNSWNRFWGDHGYGYLPYRYINDYLWMAWAARDISVTREMLRGPSKPLTPLEW